MRRSLFGYRRGDVEQALAEAEAEAGRQAEYARALVARGEQLEAGLTQTRQACFERDRRISYLEGELETSRADAESRLRALAALGAELDALRVSSRGQATKIRLEALREAAEVSGGLRALAESRGGDPAALLAALERAIERLGADRGDFEGLEREGAAAPAAALDVPAPGAPADEGRESAQVADAGAEGVDPDAVVDEELAALEAALVPVSPDPHRVSVDIGPFKDFSQLVSFEDAANAIPATSDISIRRFSEGRASIDVSLQQPVDLLSELEANCELRFQVRSNVANELVLDLGD